MASLYTEHNRRTIQINNLPQRPKLRLGHIRLRQAQSILTMVEALVASHVAGLPVGDDVGRWLDTIDGTLKDQLAAIGLIDKPKAGRLGKLTEFYITRKEEAKCKAGTLTRLRQSAKDAISFFGYDRRVHTITEAHCEDFRHYLLHKRTPKTLSEATTRKRCGDIRAMFTSAIKAGVLRSNPMQAVPTANISTTQRQFISEADAVKVMEQFPNAQWRLLFALARWGGLRVPSEPQALTWADINFDDNRMTVHSPKTEGYVGKESRIVPIFPEILGPLQDVFDQAEVGEVFVLPMLQDRTGAALRKPMEKAVKAAGLQQWPRMWHNLRATRQTELEDNFPTHVVCSWIGNSPGIAQQHYLQTTEDHFAAAIRSPEPVVQSGLVFGAESGAVDDGNGEKCSVICTTPTNEKAENLDIEGFPQVSSDPYGIRTRVAWMKTRCPRPD